MFRIRCLTTGEFIIVKSSAIDLLYGSRKLLPADVRADMNRSALYDPLCGGQSKLLEFTTEVSARWFINRRLTYNLRRTDYSKLALMKAIFEDNDLPEVTVKVEFEVVEVI